MIHILLQMNPGNGFFGKPYDSTQGFTEKGKIVVFAICLVFLLYLGLRVWWSIRKMKIRELDIVTSKKRIKNVPKGSKGTVVIILEKDKVFLVEFFGKKGNTLNVLDVQSDEIEKVGRG